jgi:steroid delta-isomerase
MAAVTAGDRGAWLACYADDAVLHDPVGGSPLDPEGAGLRGRAALERLWDLTIAPNEVHFEIDAIHSGGSEAVVVASVTLRLATGATADYDGVFLYRVDGEGRIASMRSFFDLERLLAAFGA